MAQTRIASAISADPIGWLGAPSRGGLALPDAMPSASTLYAPRGVYLDDQLCIVVDSGNHRVLIWHSGLPDKHSSADVVLGQPNMASEGPKLGAAGLHLPTGVAVIEGRLLIADAWHHRVLIWDSIPQANNTPADRVIGQADTTEVQPNRGGEVGPQTLYWPYGLGMVGGKFYITDTQNRRVLFWHGVPEPDTPPEGILGQDNLSSALENRGTGAGPCSFRWPHAVAGDQETLLIADAGNHRVLGWTPPHSGDPIGGRPADAVLGQKDYTSTYEFPYDAQGPQRLRFPYAVAYDAGILALADTANNRVLLYNSLPRHGVYCAADAVLGQDDFTTNGENRWKAITDDSLCWPYGLWLHNDILAVADSGNNRVSLWQISRT